MMSIYFAVHSLSDVQTKRVCISHSGTHNVHVQHLRLCCQISVKLTLRLYILYSYSYFQCDHPPLPKIFSMHEFVVYDIHVPGVLACTRIHVHVHVHVHFYIVERWKFFTEQGHPSNVHSPLSKQSGWLLCHNEAVTWLDLWPGGIGCSTHFRPWRLCHRHDNQCVPVSTDWVARGRFSRPGSVS